MANLYPKNNYSAYVFGSDAFVTTGTTTSTAPGGYSNLPITEGTAAGAVSITATQTTPGYVYYSNPIQQQHAQQLQRHQLEMLQQAMLQASVDWPGYYQTIWDAEEPKALKTRSLSASDRAQLDKELPF